MQSHKWLMILVGFVSLFILMLHGRSSSDTRTYAVYGAIGEKYAKLGGRNGYLGAPLSDEADAPYGGRFNRFERGYIYYHPTTGAFAVVGAIAEKYQQINGPAYGYPITDELATPDGVGRFNHFRAVHLPGNPEASIYWTQETGPQEIYGGIRLAWARQGWERGELRYPIAPEFQEGIYRRQNFQGGYILYTPETGGVVHSAAKTARCDAYTKQAIAQAQEYFQRGCGMPGRDGRWQTDYQHHFRWCMGPNGGNAANETRARQGVLSQCSTINPLPGTGPQQTTDTKPLCKFSATIYNMECLNPDGTPRDVAPQAMSSLGCGSNSDKALEAAKLGFENVFGAKVVEEEDELEPGTCKYEASHTADCLCK